jgi:hypothetical protein
LPLLVKVPRGGFGAIFAVPARPCRLCPPQSASGMDFASKGQGGQSPARRLALAEEATSYSRRAAGRGLPALPVVTNALPRPGLPEGKLTVPTSLML